MRRLSSMRLAQPIAILIAGMLIMHATLVLFVPQMKEIFFGFGVTLPGLTQIIIDLSDFMVAFRWLTYSVIGGLAITPFFLPWAIGKIRQASLAEICGSLSLLVQGEIPLPEALTLTSESCRSPRYAQALRRLAEAVKQGRSLNDAARREGGLFRELLPVFQHQPSPAGLAAALRAFGESLTIVFDHDLRILVGLFEAVFVVVNGIFMGIIVIGIFMPLIKLLNELS